MQNIEYNVKDMIHGKFIDFDLAKNVFKTWEDMTELMKDEGNIERIMLYSKVSVSQNSPNYLAIQSASITNPQYHEHHAHGVMDSGSFWGIG